jgi:hypothetical protein
LASSHKLGRPFGLAVRWSRTESALVSEVGQVNDRASVEAIVNKTGRALAPERPALRPHPAFLAWHREHCFKQ